MPNVNDDLAKDSAICTPDFAKTKMHLRAGHELIRLHKWNATDQGRELGKVPLRGWRTSEPLNQEQARTHMESGGNIGVRLQATDLVIDVDPRNFPEGRNSFRELCDALSIDPQGWPHVHTGGGGLHYYLRKPAELMVCGELKDFPGVEFKTLGRQVLAAGSLHPKMRAYYIVDFVDDAIDNPPTAPATLLSAIKRSPRVSNAPGGGIPPALLPELLEPIDPADYRDHTKWLNLMMAVHHATQGAGAEEFIAWSTSDPEFIDAGAIIRRRWDSLDPARPGAITVKSLFKILAELGRNDLIQRATSAMPPDFLEEPELPEEVKAARRVVTDEGPILVRRHTRSKSIFKT